MSEVMQMTVGVSCTLADGYVCKSSTTLLLSHEDVRAVCEHHELTETFDESVPNRFSIIGSSALVTIEEVDRVTNDWNILSDLYSGSRTNHAEARIARKMKERDESLEGFIAYYGLQLVSDVHSGLTGIGELLYYSEQKDKFYLFCGKGIHPVHAWTKPEDGSWMEAVEAIRYMVARNYADACINHLIETIVDAKTY
jgi:hypothetical protein